jgi:hypothetical protein
MGNMSYCRFENTSKDLEDCIEALRNYEDECNNLSSYEVEALEDLISQAKEVIELTETIDQVIKMNKE